MDWNHTATLLHIADKANQWPTLHGLRDAALIELKKIHDEAAKLVAEERKKHEEWVAAEKAKAEKEAADKAKEESQPRKSLVQKAEEELKTDFTRLRQNLHESSHATKPEVE